MPVLPQGMELSTPITNQRQPSLTWYINKETNQIEGETDGLAAVRQAVEIILNCERFRWQIYQPYSGVEWDIIGLDPGYAATMLLRRVTDALMVDDRVRGISNYQYSVEGNVLTASMTIETVYGETQTRVEVNLA